MKRYLLFVFRDYYAAGGMYDHYSSSDSLVDLQSTPFTDPYPDDEPENMQILDSFTGDTLEAYWTGSSGVRTHINRRWRIQE